MKKYLFYYMGSIGLVLFVSAPNSLLKLIGLFLMAIWIWKVSEKLFG